MKAMRLVKTVVISLCMGSSMMLVAQATPQKDDLFAGTEMFSKGASSATEINMGPRSLDMVGGNDGRRAHNTILSVVHTYGYDKPGMYRMEDVETFRHKLESGDWNCSVRTRDMKSGSSTDVCSKNRTDGLLESAIITVEPKQLTFIHTIRKKGSEDGHSDIIIVPGVPGLSMLQMQPMLLGMQPRIEMAMNSIDTDAIQAQVQESLKHSKVLDSAEMQKRMAEAEKSLKDAEKQMQSDHKKPE